MIDQAIPIGGSIVVSAGTIWALGRQLLAYYFEKQKELKTKEAELIEANSNLLKVTFENIHTSLLKDITGLGAKNAEFQRIYNELDVTINKLQATIQKLNFIVEHDQKEFEKFRNGIDIRIKELIQLDKRGLN